jgi:hypothetical protein
LAPTDAIDLTGRGAEWQPDSTGLHSACGYGESAWIREVLPAGWGDTYIQSAAGQAFNVTDVPNGEYLLRMTVNPEGHLYESDYSNDVSNRRIRLGGTAGHRTVEVVN